MNQNNKMRKYDASPTPIPSSQSLSKNRDVINSLSRVSTYSNPSRQAYQCSLRESLINQNTIYLNQVQSQRRLMNQEINEGYFNNIGSQIQNDNQTQILENHQNLGQNKQLLKYNQTNKRNSESISFNQLKTLDINQSKQIYTEQNDDQIKLNDNKISLPTLNMSENNQQRKNKDQEISNTDRQIHQDFNNDNTNQDLEFTLNKNKEILKIKSNVCNLQNQIKLSPRLVSFQEKQKFYRTKNPQFNNQQKIPQLNSNNKQLIRSPITETLSSKQNSRTNQLDQIHSPDQFYNQLGRFNLYSQQEKRLQANQLIQRNIQSQQSNNTMQY